MSHLNRPLAVAFLFYIGAVGGWVLEFFFRNLVSHKGPKGRFFINPGFCKGPWLPIYGIGLAVLCLMSEFVYSVLDPSIAASVLGTVIIILVMGMTMVLIEFLGGLFLLKVMNMRLWDYRSRPGNVMGLICPLFSVIWTAIAAVYYLFIHRVSMENLLWFSQHLDFAFFVGLFFGFFILDMWGAFADAALIKRFANDHEVVVLYEDLKALLQQKRMESNAKQHFFHQILAKGADMEASLEAGLEAMESKTEAFKKKFGK